MSKKNLGYIDKLKTVFAKVSDLKKVATSGDYNDLINKPTVPSKTSQLTNDSNFITKVDESLSDSSVNPVQNKAIQKALNNLQNGIANIELVEIVTSLPTSNISANKLYFKRNTGSKSENLYDIYAYINSNWEQIDALNIDISEYAKKTDLNNLVDTNDSRLSNARTPTTHNHGNISNAGVISGQSNKNVVTDSNGQIITENKPIIPSKTSQLTNDSNFLTSHQDISGKVDKIIGKGLSTNDFTTAEKNKLAGLNTVTIDSELKNNSANPVQNKVVKDALDNKADKDHTHELLFKKLLYTMQLGPGLDGYCDIYTDGSSVFLKFTGTVTGINPNVSTPVGTLPIEFAPPGYVTGPASFESTSYNKVSVGADGTIYVIADSNHTYVPLKTGLQYPLIK